MAVALYGKRQAGMQPGHLVCALPQLCCLDYQATGEDEISFDPEDVIEDIEQVDLLPSLGSFVLRRVVNCTLVA